VLFNVDRKKIHIQLSVEVARESHLQAGPMFISKVSFIHTLGIYSFFPQSTFDYITSVHTTDTQGAMITSIPTALNTNFMLMPSKLIFVV
jgi:hypothetical protein